MHTRLLGFAAALGLLAGLAPASADEIGDLSTELQRRRDTDFPAPLDSAERRELKLVIDAIALLDRPAANVGARVRTLVAVSKDLAKAFPAEFAAPATTNLRSLFDAVVGSVRAEEDADYQVLATAVPAILDRRLHDQADRLRAAARTQLDLAVATPADALRRLDGAARLVARGRSLAAKDSRDERFAGKFDRLRPWATDDVRVEITKLADRYLIDAVGTRTRPGNFLEVRWVSEDYDPVKGAGSFRGSGTVSFGTDPDTITDVLSSGAERIDIVEFDPAAKTFRARIDWYLTLGGQLIASTEVTGVIVTTNATFR